MEQVGIQVKTDKESGEILLVAINFPPVIGGSASVYSQLAEKAQGRIRVLTSWRSYRDSKELKGWHEHDRKLSYPVKRLPLLRTPLSGLSESSLSRLRLLANEISLRSRITATLVWMLVRYPVRCVCVGELVANGWIVKMLKFWPGIKTVIYVHGEELTTHDGYDTAGTRRRAYLLGADAIVAVSQFTAATVREFMGREVPISIISNGVDATRYAETGHGDIREHYGLDDCFVFISVCRLVPKKGIDHALLAFARVVELLPDTRYLIVGEGEDKMRLEAIVANHGLENRVSFTGYVEDVRLPEYYKACDTFLMPNRRMENGDTEGFGLVFLEANAAGLPVIAGKDGGSVDAVTDGFNGLLVDGYSVDEIEAAMVSLMQDAELRRRLADNGLRHAQENDWSSKASQFIQLCLGA